GNPFLKHEGTSFASLPLNDFNQGQPYMTNTVRSKIAEDAVFQDESAI
ncbi:MAG: hypothetical protein HY578_00315, partial [Nitrospinae bacterium]|nr:hypothetical protein [Nitrospinota bacterium]